MTQLKGSYDDLEDARWARMTDAELKAEIIKTAVRFGIDPSTAPAGLDAAIAWMRQEVEGLRKAS